MRVADKTIVELSSYTIAEAGEFFSSIELEGSAAQIAEEPLKETRNRSYVVTIPDAALRVMSVSGEIDRGKGLKAILRDLDREGHGHVQG